MVAAIADPSCFQVEHQPDIPVYNWVHYKSTRTGAFFRKNGTGGTTCPDQE
jgi:hypothetical protein